MKKANLFILGAPKCGTTSLADWLRQHPQVFVPAGLNEPNFFNTDHLDESRIDLRDYERLFRTAEGRHKYACDKSVWYLSSKEAVPNILAYSRDAKFIVCVRSPVDMAYSLHHHQLYEGIETLSKFRDSWDAQSARAENPNRPAQTSTYLLHGRTCKLGAQLELLMNRAPRDRIHVVFMDDIKQAPEAVYAGLLKFLDLQPFTPEFRTVNEAKVPRFPWLRQMAIKAGALKRALGIRYPFGILTRIGMWNRKARRWRADEQMTVVLRQYFRDDVALLGQLTGRDLSHWLR